MSKQIEIAVVVDGGVVQDVFCSHPEFNYTVVDYDNLREDYDDPEAEAKRMLRDCGFDEHGQLY